MGTRVAILSHEGSILPLEETLVNMLTQLCFTLKLSLETDILVDNVAYYDDVANKYHEKLKLVDRPLYKKIQVDRTEHIKNINAELIIMLCHGSPRNTATDFPAALRFRCTTSDAGRGHSGLLVFAKSTRRVCDPGSILLHDVIRGSKIVIMLACYGNEVVADYLQSLESVHNDTGDKYPMYPDILMCPGEVSNVTVHIFGVLFINLLESQVVTLPVQDLYRDVRTVILRIMQIVKLFGSDHDGFWEFLKRVNCITEEKQMKREQQLPFPSSRMPQNCYRIYGHVAAIDLDESVQAVFTEFQNLTLMSRGENGMPEYTTAANVAPIELGSESTGVTYVDTALKRRKLQNEHLEGLQHVFHQPLHADPSLGLLYEMRHLLR